MSELKMNSSVRKGAMRASCFNSGMEVWLYDEANLEKIKASGAIDALLEGDEEAFDKKMKVLLKEGLLVAYGMEGDGGVDIDVIVGEPLSKKELSIACWLKVQKAYLSLPSGKLCVESNDCLRLGSEEPTDKGAVLKLAPGNYLLNLYRIDWDEMERKEIENYQGPQEVIVLTAGASVKALSKAPSILPFERPANPAADYAVIGDEVIGQANFDSYWDTFCFGIDRKGVEQLGLKDGDLVQISAPGSGIETTVVYLLPEPDMSVFIKRSSNLRAPACKTKEWAYGYLMQHAACGGQEVLFCMRRDAKVCIEKKMMNKWQEARLKIYKRK